MAPTSEKTRVIVSHDFGGLVTYLIGNWEVRASCYPLVICYIAIENGHKE